MTLTEVITNDESLGQIAGAILDVLLDREIITTDQLDDGTEESLIDSLKSSLASLEVGE